MARLIHLSDLHFGAHDATLVEAVAARVDEEKPDLVVINLGGNDLLVADRESRIEPAPARATSCSL